MLTVEGLQKRYGAVEALRGLSFSVPRGAFCGFCGRNGAGKSTALNIISGLTPRDGGRVVLLGDDLRLEPRVQTKARFAYVAGHLQLYWWMTCRQHIDFVARFYPTWERERECELLDLFRIPLRQRVSTLTTGQYLQLQLLMALAHRPELLLIDEPGNLDAVVRQRLMEGMLTAIADEAMTVVMASHLVSELDAVCDHLCVIDHGRTLVSGPVESLRQSVRRVHYRGVTRAVPPEELSRVAADWGDSALRLRAETGGVRTTVAGYTAERAAHLAQLLGAEGYEVEHLALQDLFIALTDELE